MDSLLLAITENRVLIYAHLFVALLILMMFSLMSDKFNWSRFRVIIFGGLYTLTRRMQYAWAVSISRLITICYLAIFPDRMGVEFVIAILLLTVVIMILSGDLRGFVNQLIIYTGIMVALFLQGLFSSYYREVEGAFILQVFSVYLGSFAALFGIYQTLRGHERMLMICGGATAEELERRAHESDGGLNTFRTYVKSKVSKKA